MFTVYIPLLLSTTALIISVASFLFFKSYLKRRTSQERILAEFREEVNNIIKSIAETTDRDISLIEDREKKLKNLLDEIDKRLGLYIREMEQYNKAEKAHAALPALEKKPAPTYSALGKKRYKGDIPKPAAADDSVPETSPLLDTPPPALSVSEQIRALMRSGLTDAAIASRLGISIAEVEVATALFERRNEYQ